MGTRACKLVGMVLGGQLFCNIVVIIPGAYSGVARSLVSGSVDVEVVSIARS